MPVATRRSETRWRSTSRLSPALGGRCRPPLGELAGGRRSRTGTPSVRSGPRLSRDRRHRQQVAAICVVGPINRDKLSHWRQTEPGHRHRAALRRVAQPGPGDPKRRTPCVRRGNKTPPGSNFRWAARKRGERTLLPSAAGRRTSSAPALPGRRAVRGAPGDARPGRAVGDRSVGGTSGVRATASVSLW